MLFLRNVILKTTVHNNLQIKFRNSNRMGGVEQGVSGPEITKVFFRFHQSRSGRTGVELEKV